MEQERQPAVRSGPVSVSRFRLSCLETFEPFALEYPIFHLNCLWGSGVGPIKRLDFSVPS